MNMNTEPKNCIVQIYKAVINQIKKQKIRLKAVTASRRILIFIFGGNRLACYLKIIDEQVRFIII